MKLRFTIREIILVTIIVGMAISWCFDHWKLASDFRLSLDRGTRIAKERDEMEEKTNKQMQAIWRQEEDLRARRNALEREVREAKAKALKK